MGLQLELQTLPREVQRPLEQIAKKFPLGTQDVQDGSVTDDKLATRIVRGEVAANGTITRGSGFSVVRNGNGDYTVTFDTAFAATPVVVVTAGATANFLFAKLHNATVPSATVFRVNTLISTTGAAADSIFDFIAISV